MAHSTDRSTASGPIRVFISYSSKDREAAEEICGALETAGIDCWIAPRNILGIKDYASEIIDGLEGARLLLLVFSKRSNVSAHVRREVQQAVSDEKPIVPYRLERLKPDGALEYLLAGLQWVNGFPEPRAERLAELRTRVRVVLDHLESPDGARAVAATPRAVEPRSEPVSWRRRLLLWGLPALALAALGVGSWQLLGRGAPAPERLQVGGAELERDRPVDVLSLATRMEWAFPEELEGSRGQYEVQIGPDPGLAEAESWWSPSRALSLNEVVLPGNDRGVRSPDGQVFWRVRAKLSDGELTPWSETATFYFFFDAMDRIRRRGVLTMGTSDSSMDVFSKKNQAGEWVGIDIALAREVIRDLSREFESLAPEPRIEDLPWHYKDDHPRYYREHQAAEPLGPGHKAKHKTIGLLDELLVSRGVDMVLSGMSRTADREYDYEVRFSEPYYTAHQCLVTLPEGPISSVRDAVGRRIGAQAATTNHNLAVYLKTTAREFEGAGSADRMFEALDKHEIDAILLDEPFAYWKNRNLGDRFRILVVGEQEIAELLAEGLLERPYSGSLIEEYAVAIHKNDTELRNAVNATLHRLREAGTLEQWKRDFVTQPGS